MKNQVEGRKQLTASEAATAALEERVRQAAEVAAVMEAERLVPGAPLPKPQPERSKEEAVKAEVQRLTAAVDDQPDATGWSPKRDALLLLLRQRGVPWSAISIPGPEGRRHSERRCQKRYALLTQAARGARAAATAVTPEATERDGIEWLSRKGRLTERRQAAALHYRYALRDAGGAMIKSSLASAGLPGGGFHQEARLASYAEAKRELFVLRWVVLGGQDDLLTVMDGVCGAGHTLRQLAGPGSDDKVKDRAKVLEAILMVALDLIAQHLEARDGGADAA